MNESSIYISISLCAPFELKNLLQNPLGSQRKRKKMQRNEIPRNLNIIKTMRATIDQAYCIINKNIYLHIDRMIKNNNNNNSEAHKKSIASTTAIEFWIKLLWCERERNKKNIK